MDKERKRQTCILFKTISNYKQLSTYSFIGLLVIRELDAKGLERLTVKFRMGESRKEDTKDEHELCSYRDYFNFHSDKDHLDDQKVISFFVFGSWRGNEVNTRCLAKYLGHVDAQQRLLLFKRSEGEVSIQEGPEHVGRALT